jgi:hypothetical protein
VSKPLMALVALAFPLVVFFAIGSLLEHLVGKTRPPGQKAINTSLHYGVDDVVRYWTLHQKMAAPDSLLARIGPGTGLDAERRFLEIDLIFAVLYPAALALSLRWIWGALSRPFPGAWLLAPLVVVVLSDWTENLIQLSQMPRFLNLLRLEPGWIAAASAATSIKVLGTVGSYVALVVLVIRFLRGGGREV